MVYMGWNIRYTALQDAWGLIGTATAENDGLISKNWFIYRGVINIESYEETTIMIGLLGKNCDRIMPFFRSGGTSTTCNGW